MCAAGLHLLLTLPLLSIAHMAYHTSSSATLHRSLLPTSVPYLLRFSLFSVHGSPFSSVITIVTRKPDVPRCATGELQRKNYAAAQTDVPTSSAAYRRYALYLPLTKPTAGQTPGGAQDRNAIQDADDEPTLCSTRIVAPASFYSTSNVT